MWRHPEDPLMVRTERLRSMLQRLKVPAEGHLYPVSRRLREVALMGEGEMNELINAEYETKCYRVAKSLAVQSQQHPNLVTFHYINGCQS